MNAIDARRASDAISAPRAAHSALGGHGAAWIDMDAATCARWTIGHVRRRLAEHPLLQFDAAAGLGARPQLDAPRTSVFACVAGH